MILSQEVWGLEILYSKKLPGDRGAAGPGTSLSSRELESRHGKQNNLVVRGGISKKVLCKKGENVGN